jgi:cellulose synthase/poly-beta-1,6-N-acetylglucosamine synthase-like glycosyltransferase
VSWHDVLVVLLAAAVAAGIIPVVAGLVQYLLVPVHAFRNHLGAAAPYLPRVVVVVPAWNEGAVLGASLERLMRLEYPPERLRVYVVDDASTDDTPDVVLAKADQYPGRIVHLRRAQGGQGKAHTLNHGIRHALADDWMQALLIMDADVIYRPDSLRRMTRHLADPDVGAGPSRGSSATST